MLYCYHPAVGIGQVSKPGNGMKLDAAGVDAGSTKVFHVDLR